VVGHACRSLGSISRAIKDQQDDRTCERRRSLGTWNRRVTWIKTRKPLRVDALASNTCHVNNHENEAVNLKTYTAQALDEWLRGWDSKQPDDIKRFYDFVIHYRAAQGYEMDKAATDPRRTITLLEQTAAPQPYITTTPSPSATGDSGVSTRSVSAPRLDRFA
jgi:hypothetical protein